MRARRSVRVACTALLTWVLTLGVAVAADPQEGSGAAAGESADAWSGSASLALYFLPHESNYVIPIAAAERGGLHLEARYNYEDRKTGSVFAGWKLERGDTVELTVVPMIGAVLGRTNGVAPGLELTVDWRALEYYLETEVVFDLEHGANSYFYAWSEFSVAPADWFRAGLVLQRTRVFQTERELTPGPFVRFSRGRFQASAYWFAPGADDQYASVSLGVQF